MDSISRFTTSFTKISEELKPEETQQAEIPQPPANTGIANTADGFEAASNLFGILQQQTGTSEKNQLVIPPDPMIDASMLFEYVVDVGEPAAPVPPEPPELFTAGGLSSPNESPQQSSGGLSTTNKKEYSESGSATVSESENYGKDQEMPENLSTLGEGGERAKGGVKESWNLFEFGKIDEKAEGEWGSAYAKGSTQILAVSGEANFNVEADPGNFTFKAGAGARGSAVIVGTHYEAGYKTPNLNIGDSEVNINTEIKADAYVGVKGSAEGDITLGKENHLELGAGAFDGANAGLSGEVGAGELGEGHGQIGAWAGIGAKAGFEVGFKGGKFSADMGLGLAIGAGLEWDLGISIDFGEIAETGLDALREIGLEGPADWIGNTGGDMIEFVGDAADWTGGAIEDAGSWTAEATEDAANWTAEAAEEAIKAAEDAAAAAKKAAEDAAEAAKKAAEAAAQAAQDALDAAAQAAEDALNAAGDAAEDVVEFFEGLW